MKIHFVTIVLDGFPFVTWHYPIFRQLKLNWHWTVVEGVADPVGCTKWVAKIPPRVSSDGTHQYLQDLSKFDQRVTHIHHPKWPGKVAMFNEAIGRIIDREYLLWQVDSDEVWTKEQIELAYGLLTANDSTNCMWFRCRYYVGPDIVITSRTGYGNHEAYEWRRLWRVPRGTSFSTHEPPVLKNYIAFPWTQAETERIGLVFDHFAYATETQVAFKERYYAGALNPNRHLYRGAVDGWRRLQAAWMPVSDLATYLPWVGPGVTVDRVKP